MIMSSAVLIHELRKSLYERLYYSLVDSDLLLKKLNKNQVIRMMETVKRQQGTIYRFKNANNTIAFKRKLDINLIPKRFRDTYNTEAEKLYEKYGKNELVFSAAESKKKLTEENNRRVKAREKAFTKLNTDTANSIVEYYSVNPEEKLILEYIEENHPNETKDKVMDAVANYEKRLDVQRKKTSDKSTKERAKQKKISDAESKRIKELLDEKYAELDAKRQEEKENRPPSAKLIDEWIANSSKKLPYGPQTKDALVEYEGLIKLLELVGSLYTANKDTILRLKKFLSSKKIENEEGDIVTVPEQIISDDDRKKLEIILTELEKEVEAKKKVRARDVNITPNQLEAKDKGLEIGKNSSYRGKKTRVLRVDYDTDYRTFNKDFLKTFSTIDLTEDKWFNNEFLREIGEYWLEKMEYTKGFQKWTEEEGSVKQEYINKVRSFLPEYPSLKSGKVGLITNLVTLYNDIWDDYTISEETGPEDFAYFAQGIRDGLLSTNRDVKLTDFSKLRMFQTDILPKLIEAIKKGIIIDEDNKKKFRLGPKFSKILRAYGTRQEVTSVIEDLIDIAKGDTLSEKYSGRDADEIEAIENSIKEMLSEEVYDETILSYIITTFLQLYKNMSILRRLINTENTEIDVEYLGEPDKPGSSMSPKPTRKPRAKIKEFDLRNPRGFENYIKEETARLKKVKITKDDLKDEKYKGKRVGSRKYTDEDIHRMLGWKKSGKNYIKYKPAISENLKETKKSLDNLLVVMGEQDDIIIKEDVGLILESLNKTQKKKIKAILNIADPTEYFGHDFLKLSELIRLLKTLGVVKGDKKLNKKVLRLDDENVKVVKLAARLRKDYENLYRDLRKLIYPKSGE